MKVILQNNKIEVLNRKLNEYLSREIWILEKMYNFKYNIIDLKEKNKNKKWIFIFDEMILFTLEDRLLDIILKKYILGTLLDEKNMTFNNILSRIDRDIFSNTYFEKNINSSDEKILKKITNAYNVIADYNLTGGQNCVWWTGLN